MWKFLNEPITSPYGAGKFLSTMIVVSVALMVMIYLAPNQRESYAKYHCELFRSHARTHTERLMVEQIQIEAGVFCYDIFRRTR